MNLLPSAPCNPCHSQKGFTLVEMMIAIMVGSVVFAVGLTTLVNLQKSYAATEQYATSVADQMRLADYLSLDLRRATQVTPDADGNGIMLSVPDYYYYVAADKAKTDPQPNTPTIAADHSGAIYGSSANPPRVYYHFDAASGNITREEIPAGKNPTNIPPAQQIIAGSMTSFPGIVFDDAIRPKTAQVTVTFHPMFQTPATPNNNKITLHNVTFLRNSENHY